MVVESGAGAGGTTGTGVAAQANDGHTQLMVSIAHAVNVALYPRLRQDPDADLPGQPPPSARKIEQRDGRVAGWYDNLDPADTHHAG